MLAGDLSVLDTVSEGDYYDSAADLKELIDKNRKVAKKKKKYTEEILDKLCLASLAPLCIK